MQRFREVYAEMSTKASLGSMNHQATLDEVIGGYAGGMELQTEDAIVPMSGGAAKQLFGSVGLQVAEMKKFGGYPDLQRAMLQARLADSGKAEEQIIARGVEDYHGKGPLYQMFVRAEKLPVLNGSVLDALYTTLPETAQVHRGHIADRKMMLRIVDEQWYHDLGSGGKALTAIVVENDEKGFGGLQVKTGVTRVACWNYTLDHQPVYQHSVGFIAPQKLADEFGIAIERLHETANAVSERLNAFHDVSIDDVQGMLRLMSGEMGLPEYVTKESEEWWKDAGATPTLFWVVQALAFGTDKMTTRKNPQWSRRAVAESQVFHMADEYAETGEIHLHECPRCHRAMNVYDDAINVEYTVE